MQQQTPVRTGAATSAVSHFCYFAQMHQAVFVTLAAATLLHLAGAAITASLLAYLPVELFC